MNEQEARAVIIALESGQEFVFSNYAADTREVLKFDKSTRYFIFTRCNAYDPDNQEINTFTQHEMQVELERNFSYDSFELPPVARTT
jgi:hypothetical protein